VQAGPQREWEAYEVRKAIVCNWRLVPSNLWGDPGVRREPVSAWAYSSASATFSFIFGKNSRSITLKESG
jgi:hypothetical protein